MGKKDDPPARYGKATSIMTALNGGAGSKAGTKATSIMEELNGGGHSGKRSEGSAKGTPFNLGKSPEMKTKVNLPSVKETKDKVDKQMKDTKKMADKARGN